MTVLRVPGAECVQFLAEGEMPMAIVETWQQVWKSFPGDGLRREFTYDVEIHPGEGDVPAKVLVAVDSVKPTG